MGKRLWLDDIRKPPFGYDLWAKTADECIAMLQVYDVEHVSLDHDLAAEHYRDVEAGSAAGHEATTTCPLDRESYREKTGYAVLDWMHEHNAWTPDISVHTLNPRGAEDMLSKLRNSAPANVVYRRVWPKTA